MHMLYDSDSFAVVMFDIPVAAEGDGGATSRGGFEIVDKFGQKDIFIEGAVADSFKAGVETLMATQPSPEEIDDYIGGFTAMRSQPLVLH